jgi:steroid delta-isomerase-like uncharacterized protein
MPVEENIQLMQRWFREVWNEGRLETISDLMAADGIARGQRGGETEIRGPEEFTKFVREIRGAFPDINLTVEDIVAAGDKIAVRWVGTMTHHGDLQGIAATGKPVRSRGISLARIVDGKIVEGWDNWDQLGMLEQIGVFRPSEDAPLAKSA